MPMTWDRKVECTGPYLSRCQDLPSLFLLQTHVFSTVFLTQKTGSEICPHPRQTEFWRRHCKIITAVGQDEVERTWSRAPPHFVALEHWQVQATDSRLSVFETGTGTPKKVQRQIGTSERRKSKEHCH